MRHRKIERWLSDDLDGALSEGNKVKLQAHLAVCPDCRAYENFLARLQEGSRDRTPGRTGEERRESLARLSDLLGAVPAASGRGGRSSFFRFPGLFPERRAWAGAVGVLVLAAALYLVLAPGKRLPAELPAFAVQDPWIGIDLQLTEDEGLADEISRTIRASLEDPLSAEHAELVPFLDDQALFLEGLSDEEVLLLETVLAREIVN